MIIQINISEINATSSSFKKYITFCEALIIRFGIQLFEVLANKKKKSPDVDDTSIIPGQVMLEPNQNNPTKIE